MIAVRLDDDDEDTPGSVDRETLRSLDEAVARLAARVGPGGRHDDDLIDQMITAVQAEMNHMTGERLAGNGSGECTLNHPTSAAGTPPVTTEGDQ